MDEFGEGPGVAVEVRRDEDGYVRITIPQFAIEIKGESSEDALAALSPALSHTAEHLASYLRYLFDEEGVLDQDLEMWMRQPGEEAFGILAHIVPADATDDGDIEPDPDQDEDSNA